MSAATRWSLLVASEALLVLYMLMFGSTLFADISLHRVQIGILAVLGGMGWLVILWRPHLLSSLLVVAPLPILGSVAVTSLTSPYPSLSGYATWYSAAYVGIAWLLAIQASHPVGRRNLVAVMGIVVTIVIVVYLVRVGSAWYDWLAIGFPVTSVPLRPNYTGGWVYIPPWLADVVVLCAPVAAVSLWQRHARVLSLVLVISALVAIVLSGTRSVLLLIAAVAIVVAPSVIARRGNRRSTAIFAIALGVVAALGITFVLLARGPAFDQGRSSLIASAVNQFVASPVVGSGPRTYGVGRMSDAVDTISNLAQSDALNVVLTSAADSGIVGLAGLGLSVVAYAISMRRVSRGASTGRALIMAGGLGTIVFAGHSLGEYVFGLIGMVVLLIAAASIAATNEEVQPRHIDRRPPSLTVVLIVGVLVIVVSSVVVVRSESTRDGVSSADALIEGSPALALEIARAATVASPDSVPAWWVRMVAADAVGDITDSLSAARRIVDLEGFGQEWLSLGVLRARAGDAAGAREAVDRAVSFAAVDPVVELNAAIYYDAIGATDQARTAVKRLLVAQPDIEPIFGAVIPRIARIAESVRGEAMIQGLSVDPGTALLIALSGQDRGLAADLLQRVAANSPTMADFLRPIEAAWFGDSVARTTFDAQTMAHPASFQLVWSWRLAVHACDSTAADRWERAIDILANYPRSMPTTVGVSPAFSVRSLPPRYPSEVWGTDGPERPYVSGIWTYGFGRSLCSQQ